MSKISAPVPRAPKGLNRGAGTGCLGLKDASSSQNFAWSVPSNCEHDYIAGLALIVASMGLYGLAAQHFARRLKEVGMRKMLGASVAQILLLVNREFVLLLSAAGVLATALAFAGLRVLLQYGEQFVGNYAPGFAPFLLANVLVFLTATLVVWRQSWNVAKVNLSQVLKHAE